MADRKTVRVVICDDSPAIRHVLRVAIDGLPSVEVVGEAEDGVDVVGVVAGTAPDSVVIDYDMPRRNGIDAIKELRGNGFGGRIFVFTGQSGDGVLLGAFAEAGADAVFLKGSLGALLDALAS
jgi:DNA-binding NarL/FixJ family response regulator